MRFVFAAGVRDVVHVERVPAAGRERVRVPRRSTYPQLLVVHVRAAMVSVELSVEHGVYVVLFVVRRVFVRKGFQSVL